MENIFNDNLQLIQKAFDLADCPFCHTDKYLHVGHVSAGRFAVQCLNCGCHGPVYSFFNMTDEEAREMIEFINGYSLLDDQALLYTELTLTVLSIEHWNSDLHLTNREHNVYYNEQGENYMLLAITNENCTPSAKVREIDSRDEATGDEHVVEGEREELKAEYEVMLEREDPRPGGSALAYDHKKARNILNYLS